MTSLKLDIDPVALRNAHECVDQDVAMERIILPDGEPSRIIVFGAPVRSGTTAMGLIMAHSPDIDMVFMQPLKGLIRQEDSVFRLPSAEESATAFIKETYGPYEEEEKYNPVQMLIDSGVPKDRITYIPGVKDPRSFWMSCIRIAGDDLDPELLASFWSYSIDLLDELPEDVSTPPFVYSPELAGNELYRLNNLLRHIGLAAIRSLEFDDKTLDKKLQLSDMFNNPERQKIFESTRRRGTYAYVERDLPDMSQVPQAIADLVQRYEYIVQGNHL